MSESASTGNHAKKIDELELGVLRSDVLATFFEELLRDKTFSPTLDEGFQAELDSVRAAFIKDPRFVLAKGTTEAARMTKRSKLRHDLLQTLEEQCLMLQEHADISEEVVCWTNKIEGH